MLPRRWLAAMALLALARAAVGADNGSCPGPATIAVVADNLSSDATVTLHVEGQLVDPGATCAGGGVTSYAMTLDCTGPGATPCGHVEGLRPGAWVHRVRVQVAGSDEQVQSQRSVVLAGMSDGTNTIPWTVYPRTFVVHAADGDELRDRLDAAAAFTAALRRRASTRHLRSRWSSVARTIRRRSCWRRSRAARPATCVRTTSTAPTGARPATASPGRAWSWTRSTPSRGRAASSCP